MASAPLHLEQVQKHDAELCRELQAELGRAGFAAIDRITDPADILSIFELVEEIISHENAHRDSMHDLGDDGEISGQPKILEIASPSEMSPALLQTAFFKRALGISKAVLGPAARLLFDHCIIKPAFNNTATAWHQDCAYGRMITLSARRLHWWLPLQDATSENGCMEFVAGSHLGPVLRHRLRTPRAHALQAQLPPGTKLVSCPLPVGGATVHLPKTLHGTGPNNTSESRLAWIVQIGIKGWRPSIMR